MPIKIPADLPARAALEDENIFVMTEDRARRQDIRPLEIVIVNLMPTKIATETQLLRLLGNSPIQVNITLLRTAAHESKNTPLRHLERFYKTFAEIRHRSFDGMIVTGAPVEHLPFEDVAYWQELLEIMGYETEAGLALAESLDHSQVFMTGHLEYDRGTLDAEYRRDLGKGLDPVVPRHYYPGDNPSAMPLMTWRAHAHLFFSNWLNYYVYQETPFSLTAISRSRETRAE